MKTLQRLLIIALCLLIPSSAMTWGPVMMSGGVASVAPPAEACGSAGLLFANYFESTTITSGTPAGCSSGDTSGTLDTATLSNAATMGFNPNDGTYALYMAAGGRNEQFTISSYDIFPNNAGTVIFYYYVSTFLATQKVFLAYPSATNYLAVETFGTNQLAVTYSGNSVSSAIYTPTTVTTGSWHKIQVSWQATGNPNLYVSVDDSVPTSNQTSNTDLTAMNDGDGTLYIGSLNAGTYVAAIDTLHIYNVFTAAPL